jgi:tRNA(adenine34) deaminase
MEIENWKMAEDGRITFPVFPFSVFLSSRFPAMLRWMSEVNIAYMRLALEEAQLAERAGEVPIGAVIVAGDQIIARAWNRTITDCDPTAHAEIVALREAARALGNYRLGEVAMYVTLEPCAMCAGALVQARVARLVYGADDPKGGAVRTCFEVLDNPKLNHRVEVTAGVLADECAALLQSFFATRR